VNFFKVYNHNKRQFHFAKPKLEQKHNSFYAKNSKVPKYIIVISKNKDVPKKNPLRFPKRRFQVRQKIVEIFKKMKILKNLPKLQIIQPYLTFKTWN
jgi:hypothetical protein